MPGKTPKAQRRDGQKAEDEELLRRDVLDVEQLLVGHLAEHRPAIERKHVDGGEDDAERAPAAAHVEAWKPPTMVRISPTKPEVPGRPTLAIENSMNSAA